MTTYQTLIAVILVVGLFLAALFVNNALRSPTPQTPLDPPLATPTPSPTPTPTPMPTNLLRYGALRWNTASQSTTPSDRTFAAADFQSDMKSGDIETNVAQTTSSTVGIRPDIPATSSNDRAEAILAFAVPASYGPIAHVYHPSAVPGPNPTCPLGGSDLHYAFDDGPTVMLPDSADAGTPAVEYDVIISTFGVATYRRITEGGDTLDTTNCFRLESQP